MNKYPRILSLLLVVLFLASCSAAAGEEPAALQTGLDPASNAEEAPTSAPALKPVADEMLEAVPVEAENEEQESAMPESEEVVESPVVEPVVVDLTEMTPAAGSSEEPKEMPQPGVPDPLVPLVQKVSQDLSNRLGIDIEAVGLVEIKDVTWPDSGLGCPEPGQMYLTVLTPGYRVVLEAGDQPYVYHTDTRDNFVLCEDGKPGADRVNPDQ